MSSNKLRGLGLGHLPILHDDLLKNRHLFTFAEVAPESYIGGDLSLMVEQMRELALSMPVTCHGLDLSIASVAPLREGMLEDVSEVLRTAEAVSYSEHLSFTEVNDRASDIYFPPTYTEAEVIRIGEKCLAVQRAFGIPFSLENVPDFLLQKFGMGEGRFFRELTDYAAIGVILNLDSIALSARASGVDYKDLIDSYPLDRVDSITVVPESCMNPIIRQLCGGFDHEMIEMARYALRKSSAESILIQTRYAENTCQSLLPLIETLQEVLEEQHAHCI